jgi:CheY-like chemotaxis protein
MLPPTTVPAARRAQPSGAGTPAIVVLLAVAEQDVNRYPVATFPTMAVHTTADAIEGIQSFRPRVLAVDLDLPSIDGIEVCRAAAQIAPCTLLVTTESVERVPAAIKVGCHSVLLKPFSVNLAAGRLGRLCRDLSVVVSPAVRAMLERGTNRTWPETACPRCAGTGAVSFDHASYRRTWYACLSCEHVWLGPRQE